ncbi:MAG: hypothetical protein U0353_23115 [Sandaracinus sp.]
MNHRLPPVAALVVAGPLLAASAVGVAQALPALTVGAPPTPTTAPEQPTLTLTLPAPAEVQIDAMGAPMDAQLLLLDDHDSLVEQDADSGDGVDARIVRFLAAGTHRVRVVEWRGRAMSARVQAQVLPPLTPVAQLAPGAPPTVLNTPQGDSARNASAEATLTIAAAGNYRLDATSTGDAELTIIQNGAIVAQDSDSGDGTNALITRQLAPGTYTLRVRDYGNRASAITVTIAPQ